MPHRPPPEHRAKRIALVLVVIGAGLGVIGVAQKTPAEIEALPGAILTLLRLFLPDPDTAKDLTNPWTLRAAAFICGISGFVAVFLIWLHSVGRTLGGLWTQFGRRDHVLLYGDSPLLDTLSPFLRDAGHRAIRARIGRPGTAPDPSVTEVPHGVAPLVARLGLHRTRAVVVDCGEDAETLSLAKPVLAHLRKTPGARVKDIAVAVSDPLISDQLFEIIRRHDLAARHRIVSFDTNTALARGALARDPLFPRAAARGQDRVHALIIGFGGLGERLLDQVMLTSLAGDLGVPRITVVDVEAEARKRSFAARRPAVLEQFDIDFVPLDICNDPLEGPAAPEAVATLGAIEQATPFTAIFLALGQQSDVMRAALLLDRARDRTGRLVAPMVYRCRLDGEAEDLLQANRLPVAADRGFIRMSIDPAALIATVLGNPVSEALARRLHEGYRQRGGVTADADLPWEHLPETYRRANIRTADHLPAKLWSLGVRMEGDPAHWVPTQADRAILTQVLAAPNDDAALLRLARIEHDRWMIDRRLDGWTYGAMRNNTRRIHPMLIPYEALERQPEELQKDIDQIKETLSFVRDLAG